MVNDEIQQPIFATRQTRTVHSGWHMHAKSMDWYSRLSSQLLVCQAIPEDSNQPFTYCAGVLTEVRPTCPTGIISHILRSGSILSNGAQSLCNPPARCCRSPGIAPPLSKGRWGGVAPRQSRRSRVGLPQLSPDGLNSRGETPSSSPFVRGKARPA